MGAQLGRDALDQALAHQDAHHPLEGGTKGREGHGGKGGRFNHPLFLCHDLCSFV